MYGIIHLLLRKIHLSDDITQDVFIKVFKNWNSFRKESSIKTWILKITRNTAINYLKSSYFKKDIFNRIFSDDKQSLSAEQEFFKQEEMNDVWKVVLELPKKHREIIILDAKYELSYEEMAETLGVSIGTVKSRLSRARSKVSKLIGRVVVMNNKQNPDWYRKIKRPNGES